MTSRVLFRGCGFNPLCGLLAGGLCFSSAVLTICASADAPLGLPVRQQLPAYQPITTGPAKTQFAPAAATIPPSQPAEHKDAALPIPPSASNGFSASVASTPVGSWSLVPAPDVKYQVGYFGSVACVSSSDCWAVGYTYDDYVHGQFQTLTEHWDGNSWALVTSANTSQNQGNTLNGVACVTTNDCWAVGYYADNTGAAQTLVEHWNGSQWIISQSVSGGVLQSVTCTSTSDCWAVGRASVGGIDQTLIEHWNGTTWSSVSSQNRGAAQANFLNGVSCLSASDCWAVGASATGVDGHYQTLAEHWDATSWSIVASVDTLPVNDDFFEGVTCLSGQCFAVGSTSSGAGYVTLIERWDGTAWTTVSSPNTSPAETNLLFSISCTNLTNCRAVGAAASGSNSQFQTLIEEWDGNSWTIITSPNTDPTLKNVLFGVACTGAADCWSVGYSFPGLIQTLAQHWDGSRWATEPSPNVTTVNSQIESAVLGVACPASSDCWAVGYFETSYVSQTLVEHWDGASWNILPSPNPNAISDFLISVACTGMSDCWAVGYATPNDGINRTLVEHWDGTNWSIVDSPNFGSGDNNQLRSVACASQSDCWAVGYSSMATTNTDYQPLFEHWDGSGWAIVNSPTPLPIQGSLLESVTCTGSSDCWAVGYGTHSGSSSQTLTEHWDGTSWTVVASANTSTSQNNLLLGVSCVSISSCWAVGYASTSNGDQTLAERWDGSSWSIISSPNPSGRFNFLENVACTSSSNCWAVGYAVSSAYQTLIEHWDGSSWSTVSSADSSPSETNYIFGVACTNQLDCWGVGYYFGLTAADLGGHVLIQRYTPPPLQLNSVVSRMTHGAAGTFDVDLTSGSGIECRSGGANQDYLLVFAFVNPLSNVGSASVTSGTGSVSSSTIDPSDRHNYIVNVTGVTNAQLVTVTLNNLTDSIGDFSATATGSMGVLLGDVNGSRRVDAADVSSVRQQTLQTIDSTNFRNDINASGRIDAADVSIARQQTLTSLP